MKIKQNLLSLVLSSILITSNIGIINANNIYDIKGHWAESTINNFISNNYVGGYSDGTFKPNNNITRAEFVKIFNQYFGLTKTSGKVFTDTNGHWAQHEIDIAVTNQVASGLSNTTFEPNSPLTREQAATMLSNYLKLADKNHDKIALFTDGGNVSSWAKDSVEGILEKNYMGGYIDKTFKPKNQITRAEAVVTLSRVATANNPNPMPDIEIPQTPSPETSTPEDNNTPNIEDITTEHKQALKKAEDYLKYSSFSKIGLFDQLKFEGFNDSHCTYAVNNVVVNWDEQAYKKAEQYLKYSSFSKIGLFEQLEFEGFTDSQCTYALSKIVVDWNEQAYKKGEQYLKYSSFSKSGLLDQLKFEGFTDSQSTYAVDKLF
ncbi:MAG: Ltp family lipoprotein [Peptostreptococcaceae bacterium]